MLTYRSRTQRLITKPSMCLGTDDAGVDLTVTKRWKEPFDREHEISSRLARYRHLDIPFNDRSLQFWWLAQKMVRGVSARGDAWEHLQNIGDDSYQFFRTILLPEGKAVEPFMERTSISA